MFYQVTIRVDGEEYDWETEMTTSEKNVEPEELTAALHHAATAIANSVLRAVGQETSPQVAIKPGWR